jgi:hypothetical protein
MRIKSLLPAAAFLLLGTGMASATTIQYTVIFEVDRLVSEGPSVPPNPDTVFGTFKVNLDKTQNYTNQTNGIDLLNLNLVFDSPLAFSYNAATDDFTFGGLAHGAGTVVSAPVENDFSLVIGDFTAGLLNSDLKKFTYAQVALGDIKFVTLPGANNDGFALVLPGAVVATTPIPAALPLLLTALGGLGYAGFRRKRATTRAAA